MTARRWRRSAAVLVTGALAVAGLVLVGSAEAAPNQYAPSIGFATADPLTGPVTTAPVIVTQKLCPTGTTAINGFVDSKDAGLAGAVGISSNTTQIDTSSTTGINFSFNLLDVASSQGKTLVNGSYELSVVCLPDLFGTPGTGQFDAVFTVSGGATPTSAGTTFTFKPGGNVQATTTTLAADPPGSGLLTASLTLSATVSPKAAGTVQFTDVPRGQPPAPLGSPVTVDATTGVATLDLSTLTPAPGIGARVFRATFTPADPTAFAPSSAADLPYVIRSDTQIETATTLSADPATFGDKGRPVTMTAAVTAPKAPATAPVLAGTVDFVDGNLVLGTATVADGKATFTFTPAQAGTLNLTARFNPADATAYAQSTSAPSLTFLVTEPFSEGKFLDLLAVKPDRAKSSQGFSVTAPKACPAGSDALTVRVNGPGGWAPGFDIPVSEAVLDADGKELPLPSFDSIASQNNLTIVPGRYLIAATCRVKIDRSALGFFLAQIWFYTPTDWLNQDPAVVGIPTDLTLTAQPANRTETGVLPSFTATVFPADSAGTVTFTAVPATGDPTELNKVVLANGKAVTTTTKLGFGLYYLTATYAPDTKGQAKHNASSSAEMVYAVTRVVPPLAEATPRVTGTAAPGRTVTCVATFRNATARSYKWFRDGVQISGAGTIDYRIQASDAGRALACRALAGNAGGVVYRDSPAVRVGR